jgi:hypothetical protein
MPDIEHQLQAALAHDTDARALFTWMGPTQQASFVEYLRTGAAGDFDQRLAQVIDILADRPTAH